MPEPDESNNSEEAQILVRLSILLLSQGHPEDHPEVLACMEHLGDLFYAREKYDDARPVYVRLVHIRETSRRLAIESDSRERIHRTSALFKLAKCCYRLNQIDDAVSTYERAIALGNETIGPLFPNLLEACASLLRKTGRDLERAEELEAFVRELRQTH